MECAKNFLRNLSLPQPEAAHETPRPSKKRKRAASPDSELSNDTTGTLTIVRSNLDSAGIDDSEPEVGFFRRQ